jgi:hypothetical protein
MMQIANDRFTCHHHEYIGACLATFMVYIVSYRCISQPIGNKERINQPITRIRIEC